MPEERSTSFADLLRQLRSAAALSQEGLAERAGMSARGISDLERGVSQAPRLETVRLLADGLALADDKRAALLAAARPELWVKTSADRSRPPLVSLPVPLTRLIGREAERTALRTALQDEEIRWLTLTGPGGVGKTRLAVAVADELHETFPEGIVFVDLAPLSDPDLVVPTVAATLGVRESSGQRLIATLCAFLSPRRFLLVLDNCERVLAAAPEIIMLLAASPGLTIFATSREPFHVRGEHQVPLLPLPLPAADGLATPEELAQSPAVRLFIERATAVQSAFALTEDNAAAVAGICRRVDGLPLAIELAAARAKVLLPDALLTRLERRLPMLTGGVCDLPARQRTMRDAIAWSCDLLSPEQQVLFRRLAIFVGGFGLEAAEWVSEVSLRVSETQPISPPRSTVHSPTDTPPILNLLAALVDQSLLQPMPASGVKREPRFTMLETIREHGLERLEQCDEGETIRATHACHFAGLAKDIDAARTGLADSRIANLTAAEGGNLRAALAWFRSKNDAAGALRMAASLWPLWLEHGAVTEGRVLLEESLAHPNARDDLFAWARAAATLAMLAQAQGDHALVAKWSAAALEVCQLNDARGTAMALTARGLDAMVRGDYRQARNDLAEAGNTFRVVGDPRSGTWALRHLASMAFRTGQGDALRLAQEGLAIAEEQGNALDVAKSLHTLGTARAMRGDVSGASWAWEESLRRFRENDDAWGVADTLSSLGEAAAEGGNATCGLRLLNEALDGFRKVADPEGTALTLGRIGWVMRAMGELDAAVHHFDACLHLARSSSSPVQQVTSLYGLAATALTRRDTNAAAVALREALCVPGVSKARPELANGVEWGAHLMAALKQPTRSAQLLGAATYFRDHRNVRAPRALLHERESLVASLRSILGQATFTMAHAEGQSMHLSTAMRAILDEGTVALTSREREVLALLSERYSDREIADQLSISQSTVSSHVTRILSKLNVANRREAVAVAARLERV